MFGQDIAAEASAEASEWLVNVRERWGERAISRATRCSFCEIPTSPAAKISVNPAISTVYENLRSGRFLH
jgi:hypothetical protein